MAGRFPGARDLESFWSNIRGGVESVVTVSDQDLLECGLDPSIRTEPGYVAAASPIDEIDRFDAAFFGYTPREAEAIDPQQRLFLETAWHAVEDAGVDPTRMDDVIGVYAGCAMSTYALQLYANPEFMASAGVLQTLIGNDKDYLATRVSYKLDLTGPSVGVQTACSTGLVAVVLAAQALVDDQCDLAVAGAATVRVPHRAGYWFQPGGIYAPDGHCRPFSLHAAGTVFGSGLGVVVLKRLEEAIAQHYNIRAVIRGAAINNDGGFKVGFTAPSLRGQTDVIAAAHASAGIDASTIDYVEAHGTGTALGDPIEVEALTNAFAMSTERRDTCALGSLKSNIGHLDAAAGIAGFVKAVLMLEAAELPPTLHLDDPATVIPFAETPFRVNTTLQPWPRRSHPRRVGVSAFGIGGTNAHVVLEAAPTFDPDRRRRSDQVLTLSAATPAALNSLCGQMAQFLRDHRDVDLADVAYTTQIGRRPLSFRRAFVCADVAGAIEALQDASSSPADASRAQDRPKIGFIFPGQGSQHTAMAGTLYRDEPTFAETLDHCADRLRPHLNLDIRDLIGCRPETGHDVRRREETLRQTSLAQPTLFAVEYATAAMLSAWSIQPVAMLGHSVGELVAACVAGVFQLDDALDLVAERGRLVEALPAGRMLAVPLCEDDVRPLLGSGSAVAAVNEANVTVVAGPFAEMDALEQQLASDGFPCQVLHTSHAFHSPAMDPAVAPLVDAVSKVKRAPNRIPVVSNVTGTWAAGDEAANPEYWGRHLRATVRFWEGLQSLFQATTLLVEVGPGTTLSRLTLRHPARTGQPVVSTLPGPGDEVSPKRLHEAIAGVWQSGGAVDWWGFHGDHGRRRVSAPPYPFESKRYWVEGPSTAPRSPAPDPIPARSVSEWFARPTWTRCPAEGGAPARSGTWLVFGAESPLALPLISRLRRSGRRVVTVGAGPEFHREGPDAFLVVPTDPGQISSLVEAIVSETGTPMAIAHLWTATGQEDPDPSADRFDAMQALGFGSLIALGQALTASLPGVGRLDVVVTTSGVQSISGHEALSPAKATLLGPARSMSQEYPQLAVRCVDVEMSDGTALDRIAELIEEEVSAEDGESLIGLRAGERFALRFPPAPLPARAARPDCLREGGTYLMSGGLGNLGYHLAEALARQVQARLVLLGQRDLPPKARWDTIMEAEDPENPGLALRLRRLRRLEDLGASVLYRAVDLSDVCALRGALDEAEECFGALNGVIHAAGNVDPTCFPTIDELRPEHASSHFGPKAKGLIGLVQAMMGRTPVDFWLLVSSLSSVLGGLGFSAYAGANSFLDSYAEAQRARSSTPWVSVDWDAWDFNEPSSPSAISTVNGQETFLRVLGDPSIARAVVSVAPLQPRLDRWTDLRSLCGPLGPEPSRSHDGSAPHNREAEVTALWKETLGVEHVGLYDDFFADLGGNSLLATQLMSQVRARYGVDLPLKAFFDEPTVEEMCRVLETLEASPRGDDPPELGQIRRGRLTRAVLLSDGGVQVQ